MLRLVLTFAVLAGVLGVGPPRQLQSAAFAQEAPPPRPTPTPPHECERKPPVVS
jgi:hypothetical protein